MSLKIHNFLISYPILLKLFFIGLSDFSGSIESKLFLEWTWALKSILVFVNGLTSVPSASAKPPPSRRMTFHGNIL